VAEAVVGKGGTVGLKKIKSIKGGTVEKGKAGTAKWWRNTRE
jgi:hypothetical protein